MTPEKAKELIKEIGLNGVGFSSLMGKSKNYVTDFKRFGVPENIAIILHLCKELIDKKADKKDIIEIIKKARENKKRLGLYSFESLGEKTDIM